MAKSKTSTPVSEAAQPGAVPSVASGRSVVSPATVKAEQTAQEELERMAEGLAGVVTDDPPAKPARPEPPAKAEAKPSAPEKPAKAEAEDTEFDPDAPILGAEDDDTVNADDDEQTEDGTATTEEDDDNEPPEVAALKKENFKQREKRRELESQLKAVSDEKAELQRKLQALETQPTGFNDLGIYAKVKTEADVAEIEAKEQHRAEWLEELLDDHQDVYTLKIAEGQEREFSRAELRQYLKDAKWQVKLAEQARKALSTATSTEAVARKKYPFVFDAKSKHNGLVLDLVQETPALNALPNKSLLLGRLAVGKLVESGDYFLQKRSARSATATEAEAKNVVKKTVVAVPATVRRSASSATATGLMERLNRGDRDAELEAAEALLDGHPGI